jgi:DNA-binding CsgD family transcriptional regulator
MLTNRERDVLTLTARGLTNQNIADKLCISSRTVKCILHHACVKLRAHNRSQALFIAVRQGYIGVQEILSLEELFRLFDSLKPDVMELVSQHLQQKYEQCLHQVDITCTPELESNAHTKSAKKNNLLSCDSGRRPRENARNRTKGVKIQLH